jgi:hypothetical protein
MKAISKEQILSQYPDQWVLLGDPVLDDEKNLGSVMRKLVAGVVLFASKDKQEIAERAHKLRKGFDTYACVYTGEIPKNRRFLL